MDVGTEGGITSKVRLRIGTDIQLHPRLDNAIQEGEDGVPRKAHEWRVNIQCRGCGIKDRKREKRGGNRK